MHEGTEQARRFKPGSDNPPLPRTEPWDPCPYCEGTIVSVSTSISDHDVVDVGACSGCGDPFLRTVTVAYRVDA